MVKSLAAMFSYWLSLDELLEESVDITSTSSLSLLLLLAFTST